LLDFDCWHCLHEIPSSLWVVCTVHTAWFWLLTLPAWNPIQGVSCVHLFCLILIADIACMKSHPECELCAPAVLDFDCWHCLHETPSRVWVVCTCPAWFWLLTLPAWNPIQGVSCVHLFCLTLIADIACMKSHLGSELCAPALLDFDCWHCLHEIPSRVWVVCTCPAWFWLLTLPAWNPIQRVSCVHLLCLILIADIACMKSHPESELCAPALLDFDCWHCLYEIPFREWVVFLLGLILIVNIVCIKSHSACKLCVSASFCLLTLPVWNSIQRVSCVPAGLDFDC